MSPEDKAELIVGLAETIRFTTVTHTYLMYSDFSCLSFCLVNHMHTARANKQRACRRSAESDDKFGNVCVRRRGQQGAFTPRFGLFLELAGWSRMGSRKSGNYQVIYQFRTFYYHFTTAACYFPTDDKIKHPSLHLLL